MSAIAMTVSIWNSFIDEKYPSHRFFAFLYAFAEGLSNMWKNYLQVIQFYFYNDITNRRSFFLLKLTIGTIMQCRRKIGACHVLQ